MPQLNPEFFATQLFWLVATFATLYILLSTIALPRIGAVLDDRQRRIDENLSKAAAQKAEADAVIKAYEQVLLEARTQASNHIKEAIVSLRDKAVEHNRELDERLEAQIKDSETRIEKAKEAALADVREIAAEVAGTVVSRLIGITAEAAEMTAAVGDVMKGHA